MYQYYIAEQISANKLLESLLYINLTFEVESVSFLCSTCKGSQWNCTDNECRGVCRLWGDSHYTTFDGRDYEFQGDCEHVLLQNIRSDEQHYVITAESVPCGSTGVTCAKTIRFDIGKRGN